MKYLLLSILTFLSDAVVYGFTISPDATAGNIFSSSIPAGKETEAVHTKGTLAYYKDILNDSYDNELVAEPEATCPLLESKFRNKPDVDKILTGIKKLSDIHVKKVIDAGINKLRIIRLPEGMKSETALLAAPADRGKPVKQPARKSDPVVDTAQYSVVSPQPEAFSDTSEFAEDTVYTGREIVFFKGHSPWLKRIRYFGESFGLVNALIVTILISISTMIILLVIILMNRRRMEEEQKMHQYLMEKYQSLIVDFLYGSAGSEEFRSIASGSYSRQVLIDQMIDVSVNLKGEESNKLLVLYKYLGLDKDSLARARDYRWHKKIKGFRELAFMNIKDANDSIRKALNSSNEILRMEAQIALVRLSDNDHFEFLDQLRQPFSLWEQITLHDLIIQHNIPVPAFNRWLTSPNDSVVIFALRMIREFKQTEAEEDIRTCLWHRSAEVRLLSVQVAGDLRLPSTLEIMKRMYKNQDYKTCLEIVKSMGKMPDRSMLGFLKLVLDKEDDVQLQIEATKSIESMGEEGVKALVKIMKSEYKNYNIIVRHVLDRRIN
jgi:hypothetical protein